MKSLLKLISVIVTAMLLGYSNHGTSARNEPLKPVAVLPKASAESLFRQKCSKCHGVDGSGDTSMGRIFNAPDFTDGGWWTGHSSTSELITAITRGKKNMPAFGKKLIRTQIYSLANYVQQFKQ